MFEFIVATIAAIVGATATHYIPLIHDVLSNSKRGELTGEWLSLSYSNDEEGWVTDRIEIKTTAFSIKFRNLDNPHGYDYVGAARLRGNRYLLGEWHSVRPGATNEGPFSLSMDSQGVYMVGVYGGAERDGTFQWSVWCLARDPDNLAHAKNLMIEASSRLATSSNTTGNVS